MKKKRGAQAGNQNAKRKTKMVATTVRASPAQLERWLDAAEDKEMEFSEWYRWACDRAAGKIKP